MRWLLALAALAACKTGDGALLTLSAQPAVSATRVEIVLASTQTDTVDHQRVAPGQLAEESERYYRQRDTAGVVRNASKLDGLQIQIEPQLARTPDTMFVPFVLAYDGAKLTAIGVVDDAGDPGTIVVEAGQVAEYPVALTAVTGADPNAAVAPDQDLEVDCTAPDQSTFASGIVWRRETGPELRLLLPDLAADPLAFDATMRPLDLDCDDHVATGQDCDDERGSFFRGKQGEVCDGLDTNCDGQRTIVVECPISTARCPTGLGEVLCADIGAGQVLPGTCTASPACLCSGNDPGCTRCILPFKRVSDPMKADPCAPATSLVTLGCTPAAPCDAVTVIAADPAWRAQIAEDPMTFTDQLTNVHAPILLRVDHPGGAVTGGPNDSVGAVYLMIKQGGSVTKLGIDLELGPGAVDVCDATMQCP